MSWLKLDKKATPLGIKREYVLITGDLASASLLSQIVYWHKPDKHGKSKLRVYRNGRWWIAKHRVGWMDECMISEAQYKRSSMLLTSSNLVLLAFYKFAGVTCPHFSLNIKALTEAMLGVEGVGWVKTAQPLELKSPAPLGENSPPPWEESAHPLYTETTTETTTETKVAADAAKETNVNVSEVLKAHEEKKTQVVEGEPLYILWKKRMSALTGKWVKEVPKKDMKMLKTIRLTLGDQAVPMLEFVLAKWMMFANEAKMCKNLTSIPIQPTIGFVMAHYDIALQLIAKTEKQPEIPVVPVQPVVYVVPTVEPVKVELTDEQKAAMAVDLDYFTKKAWGISEHG